MICKEDDDDNDNNTKDSMVGKENGIKVMSDTGDTMGSTNYHGVTMWKHEGTWCMEITFKKANKTKWNRNRMANENKFQDTFLS